MPGVPPANVISLNGTEPHDPTSTCQVKWDAFPVAQANGNLTSYRIMYSKVGTNETVYCEVGTCNISKILKELTLYSCYVVKVSATNIHGQGPNSEPVFCCTEGTGTYDVTLFTIHS